MFYLELSPIRKVDAAVVEFAIYLPVTGMASVRLIPELNVWEVFVHEQGAATPRNRGRFASPHDALKLLEIEERDRLISRALENTEILKRSAMAAGESASAPMKI